MPQRSILMSDAETSHNMLPRNRQQKIWMFYSMLSVFHVTEEQLCPIESPKEVDCSKCLQAICQKSYSTKVQSY